MPRKVRQGLWVICKQFGTGGDLIVGQIESAKYPCGRYPRGRVLTRSLTKSGFTSDKFLDVFLQKNVIVSKKKAMRVYKAFKSGGKKAAKEEAVQICVELGLRNPPRTNGAAPAPAPSRKISKVLAAVKKFNAVELKEFVTALAE